ncbi:MAG: peptide ABC transporter substrate-binding protein [Woeseiaceae bacterium]|nr:peptide ABC transporter substrate-binding protein [Woeseiaceae bacterium]
MKLVIWATSLIALLLAGCADPNLDQAADSDTIRRGNVGDVSTLDPAIAEEIHTFSVLFDLYEGLVAEDASGQIVPGVAKSWTISEDGLEYAFELRADARWSNGETVTAEDFVASFRRVAAPTTLSSYASLLSPIRNFDAVKSGQLEPHELAVSADDEGRLVIQLSTDCPYFLQLLSMPVALPVHGGGSNPKQFEDPGQFVGNGAYVLSERIVGHSTTLRRNTRYWDADSVRTEFIEYVAIVDEVSEFNRYRAGELDITASIPAGYFEQAKQQFPDELKVAPTLALYYLAFDTTEPPLDDPLVRRALSLAIDRDKLVSILGRGELPADTIVPPGTANYPAASSQRQSEDFSKPPKTASELYATAGYGRDNPLRLRLVYDAGGIHETLALAVSAMWQDQLGVKVELDKREWKYFLDTRDNREEWDVMRFAWFGDYNDPTTFLDIFQSGSEQNLSGYDSKSFDEALAIASMTEDLADRSEKLQEAERLILADQPIAPLYFFVSKRLVHPSIGGFESNVLDRHPSKFLFRRPAGQDGYN